MTDARGALTGEAHSRIREILEEGVRDGVFTVAAYACLRSSCAPVLGAVGAGIEAAGGPGAASTMRFDLASVTKPFTALLLLRAVESGLLLLSDPVKRFFAGHRGAIGEVTLKQLATHTSGLPPWMPLGMKGDAAADALNAALDAAPGSRYAYSDLGYVLLGSVIAQAGGDSLDRLMEREILAPLGLSTMAYGPLASGCPVAVTANCTSRPGQTLRGTVHDANAWRMGGVAGHAGLFGTAADVAAMARPFLCLREGDRPGRAARRLAACNQIDSTIGGHSIGWFTRPNPMLPAGDLASREAFGHTGFTGTSILIDPLNGFAIIVLTNRVVSAGDGGRIARIRRAIANIAASESITESEL